MGELGDKDHPEGAGVSATAKVSDGGILGGL